LLFVLQLPAFKAVIVILWVQFAP